MLRGKPLNCYGLTKKVVYENEEFNLLQAALNIEEDMDNLRYNKVIIATDADVDGMHIRLLMMTFFLQFFPDVIRQGHLFVLQTPLFRVRNKKETFYCYSEEERQKAVGRCGANAEITRFKGLGEISPDEFREFIGENIRLDKVRITGDDDLIHDLLRVLHGQEHLRTAGLHHRQPAHRGGHRRAGSCNQLTNMAEEKDIIGRDELLNEDASTLKLTARQTKALPPTPRPGRASSTA